MAIVNAEAQISAATTLVTLTSFQIYQRGYIDLATGFIKAQGSGRWTDLAGSTWNDFTNFTLESQGIKWTSPLIDLGLARSFTLNIELDCDGSCEFLVYVSDSGVFNGEESETLIRNGDLNVSSFFGQFVYVTATVTGTVLRRMTITYDTSNKLLKIENQNSATLAGSVSDRQIALPEPVSQIADIVIQPKAATAYPVNLYVSDTATSAAVFPVILSKDRTTPRFVLYGIDNDPRDAVVDILITAMPRMVMENNNLFVIQ